MKLLLIVGFLLLGGCANSEVKFLQMQYDLCNKVMDDFHEANCVEWDEKDGYCAMSVYKSYESPPQCHIYYQMLNKIKTKGDV